MGLPPRSPRSEGSIGISRGAWRGEQQERNGKLKDKRCREEEAERGSLRVSGPNQSS
jgi:hypothetical protein